MSNEDQAELVYSILDYPEQLAKSYLSVDEIKVLLERYSVISDFDITFVVNKRSDY